jgi:hypothetical protein
MVNGGRQFPKGGMGFALLPVALVRKGIWKKDGQRQKRPRKHQSRPKVAVSETVTHEDGYEAPT